MESPSRGIYKITQEGKNLLQTDIKLITRKFLFDNYESFRAFVNRKKTPIKITEESNNSSIIESKISPNEQIEEIYSEINNSSA